MPEQEVRLVRRQELGVPGEEGASSRRAGPGGFEGGLSSLGHLRGTYGVAQEAAEGGIGGSVPGFDYGGR